MPQKYLIAFSLDDVQSAKLSKVRWKGGLTALAKVTSHLPEMVCAGV